MLLELNEHNLNPKLLDDVVRCLKKGGIIAIPTDTVYCFACDLFNKKALEKLSRLKGVKLSKARFSMVCSNISQLTEYTKPIDRSTFKVLNRSLPGPFTFILEATNRIPKLFGSNRKRIGIRIPNNAIVLELVRSLGNPLAVGSIHDEDEILEYTTDPYQIFERFENELNMVIDGGYGNHTASTIVEVNQGEMEIIRQGVGEL
jgi:tRNA threonylcarbamoyl adenosine modification protein (Sua5/YciO/YrdC/YwlC family)